MQDRSHPSRPGGGKGEGEGSEDASEDMEVKIHQTVKCVLVGSTGVGKTSIVTRYVKGTFSPHAPTVGVDYLVKKVELSDRTCKLQLWDTAGAERFQSLTTSYYRNAHVVVIVYDVTKASTFDGPIETYVRRIRDAAPDFVTIALVGNKNDLTREKVITAQQAQRCCTSLQLHGSYQVSAKHEDEDGGIEHMFQTVLGVVKTKFPSEGITLSSPHAPEPLRAAGTREKKKKKPCCAS